MIALAVVLSAPLAARAEVTSSALYAFGENHFGELGNATNNNSAEPNPTPTPVVLAGADGPVVEAVGGSGFSLVVTSTGQLYTFGVDVFGQLASPANKNPNPTPTQVSLPGATGPVTRVAAGASHSLAVTSTGQLYAFGENFSGQLGVTTNQGTEEANPTPSLVTLPGATGSATQVAAGNAQSLVVTSSGQLYAFGNNDAGQLGNTTNNGNNHPNSTPKQVTLLGATGPVTHVAAGAFYSLALTSTGQLYAYGDNIAGQLGSATNKNTHNANPMPTQVSLPGASGPVTQIAAGYEHSLALTSSGQLYAFGGNQYGQLGILVNSGTGEPNPTPTRVTLPGAIGSIVQIAAGEDQSFALTSSGQLYAFGENNFGQLGNTTNSKSAAPNPMPTQVGFAGAATTLAVAAGPLAYHTLLLIAALELLTRSVPAGAVGVPYRAQAQALGGVTPYDWSASNLPPGLSINPASGLIAGTPTAGGTYTATLTVTDHSGIQASAPIAIPVSAPSLPALVAPLVQNVRESARRWREANKAAKISSRRKRGKSRLPLGTTFAFTLNEQATVRFAFKREVGGRRVGKRCVAQTKRNRRRHKCTRVLTAAVLGFPGHAGTNTVRFYGRVSGSKRLKPSRYTLVITATNAASQSSVPQKLSFTIVK